MADLRMCINPQPSALLSSFTRWLSSSLPLLILIAWRNNNKILFFILWLAVASAREHGSESRWVARREKQGEDHNVATTQTLLSKTWGKRFSHLDESYFSIVLCKCPFVCAWWIVRVTGNICPWWHVMFSCREAVQPSAGPRQGQKEITHCSQGSVLQTCSVTLQKTCKESVAPSFF